MSRPESSISLAEFRRKHGVSNPTCHRHIRNGWLKTVRAANGRQRVTTSAEAAWLGIKNNRGQQRS